MWEGVPHGQYGRVCPSVARCAPVWEGVTQCRRMCLNVGGCSPWPVWEGVPKCGKVCPSVGGCYPV